MSKKGPVNWTWFNSTSKSNFLTKMGSQSDRRKTVTFQEDYGLNHKSDCLKKSNKRKGSSLKTPNKPAVGNDTHIYIYIYFHFILQIHY